MNDAALNALADCVKANTDDLAWAYNALQQQQENHIAHLEQKVNDLEDELARLRWFVGA